REEQVARLAVPLGTRGGSAKEFSFGVLLGDGKAASDAERFGGDLQSRRRLLALVLITVHLGGDVAHQIERESLIAGDAARGLGLLDVGAKNSVEDVVLGKRIAVLL